MMLRTPNGAGHEKKKMALPMVHARAFINTHFTRDVLPL